MKPSEIQVGKTYRNRGAGRTKRLVLQISDEPGLGLCVNYKQIGGQWDVHDFWLSLESFARWAGSVVEEK
jgi:hypothetical protein